MQEADLKAARRTTRRPLFSPSQMLTAQQLNALIDDQRAHSERLMRALHGHGVIFGLDVGLGECRRLPGKEDRPDEAGSEGSRELRIGCGMALDRHGRLLHWPGGALAHCGIVDAPNEPGRFTLSVHHAERRTPKSGCGPCGDKPEWIEDTVVFTLTRGCEPADRACPVPGECVGWEEYICARTGSGSGKLAPAPDLEWACEDPGRLCPVECGDDRYDPAAGIPIACVELVNLAEEDCPEAWGFSWVAGACEMRPRVYRTPLLYELVNGCQDNLSRVESLSWQDWCVGIGEDSKHRVLWKDFARKFGKPEMLTVTFSRPILVSTVHRGSVFFTALRRDKEADYIMARRIPADLRPVEPGEYARTFFIDINPGWVRNEIRTASYLRGGGRIELVIRGQMLRDQCGNMLDAVPIGYRPQTPSHKRPGGDFVALFRFAEAPAKPAPRDDNDD